MRSLQVRLPLMAVGLVALSLALATFLVFEGLLVTERNRLDDRLEQEALRVRGWLARAVPGALPDERGPRPALGAVRGVLEAYLERNTRSETYMNVARIGDDVLTTGDAPARLERLRDRGRLPALGAAGLETVASAEGDLRVLTVPLRASDGGDAAVQVVGSLQAVRGDAFRSLRRMLVASGCALVISSALLGLAIRRSLRPLKDLAGAARTAELDDLDHRVRPLRGDDEVAVLAREFNRMLDRLERAVQDQKTFMATASHELRTPITIIRGHLDVLGTQGGPDATELEATLSLVQDELLRMQRLVEDLLTLGRVDQDDFVVPGRVRLRDLFDDLQLRTLALQVPGVIFASVPEETVCADAERLTQALLNLVVNSHLHAHGATGIEVGAAVRQRTLRLYVSDDGGGIHPAVRDRMFEPFAKGNGVRTQGAGLGLAVVAAVTRAHGGSVEVDTGPAGTTVTMLLPTEVTRDGPPPAQPRAGDQPARDEASETSES